MTETTRFTPRRAQTSSSSRAIGRNEALACNHELAEEDEDDADSGDAPIAASPQTK